MTTIDGEREAGPAARAEGDMVERLRAVAAAAAGLVGTDRIDRLKEVLREQLRPVVPFDAFTFALYDAATGMLRFEAGRDGELVLPPHVMPVAGTPTEGVVLTRRSLLTEASSDPRSHGASPTGTGRRSESVIRTPILAPDAVLGVLSVQSYSPQRYTSQDVELLETVAALAATAILNIRHLDERRAAEAALREEQRKAARLAARLRAAADAAVALIRAQTLESLQAVMREASAQVLPLDYCTLGLYDPATDSLRFEATVEDGRIVEGPNVIPLAGTPSERVVRTRRSMLTLRSSDPEARGAVLVGSGRRSESVIRTPVLADERVLGVISVQSYSPALYGQDDVEVLEALAALAATAILNIEYLTQRRELEAQLRQAQKMEAVGQLAGGVAHDFNNLLTAIQGNTALVLATLPEDDPHRGELREIEAAAARAARLTSQLLAFGRQQMLVPRVLSLNEQVQQMQELLRRLLPSSIRIATRLAPDLGAVMADPTQVDQVLLNLVVNARDAMSGGGEITIATRNVDVAHVEHHDGRTVEPGRYAVLEVCDTGGGMDEATLARIFEPFFSTKPHGQGTGLGLATVYGIVTQSGGAVVANSRPGHGSVFTVFLPRTESTAAAAPHNAGTRSSPHGGSETILLVEDEAPVRQLARRILEREGYRVIEAEDGRAALRLMAEGDPRVDLLLTDVMMPHMSGHFLADRLRDRNPDLRVVFMSGYAGDVLTGDTGFAAASPFVQKPFTLQSLTGTVRAVLDGTDR